MDLKLEYKQYFDIYSKKYDHIEPTLQLKSGGEEERKKRREEKRREEKRREEKRREERRGEERRGEE